ncbi:8960_t:CDS:2 [Ambispora leptoticha]|uniref:8960_t:CDS:1 n=1 Tax=Ambispora leptoticha TaxID=144679 RepID=A0A9N8ZYJ0_9GLOM|nr:8960_t:CDS:2 [Ambispora leptoticha]
MEYATEDMNKNPDIYNNSFIGNYTTKEISNISGINNNNSLGNKNDNETNPNKKLLNETEVDTLKKYVKYAAASYCSQSHLETWSCGNRCVGNVTVESIFHDGKKGAFGFLGVDREAKEIIVGFRGTHEWVSWLYNLRYLQLDYEYPNSEGALVHGGFYQIYDRVRESLLWRIQWMLNRAENSCRGYNLIISGHSLGGVLAIFLGLDVKRYILDPILEENTIGVPFDIRITTIGEPRVGNDKFAKLVESEFSKGSQNHIISRITHRNDVIPHLPPHKVGFIHHRHEIWSKSKQENFYCNDEKVEDEPVEDKECLMGSKVFDIVPHLFIWDIYFDSFC